MEKLSIRTDPAIKAVHHSVIALIGWISATLVSTLLLAATVAHAQQLESTPSPPHDHTRGYLGAASVDYRALLPAPPAIGSATDNLDTSAMMWLQANTTPDRWKMASKDADYVYPQFASAFGAPIDRTHAPRLIHMLNRVERDVATSAFAAKREFPRARPFQRFQLARVCGFNIAPPPDANPGERSSYPSGHSAYGWAAALVLAQVAPEREAQVLARGDDYELSRVICGMHFPSDVEAGRVLATAIVTRLLANSEFQRDLTAARTEHTRIGGPTMRSKGHDHAELNAVSAARLPSAYPLTTKGPGKHPALV